LLNQFVSLRISQYRQVIWITVHRAMLSYTPVRGPIRPDAVVSDAFSAVKLAKHDLSPTAFDSP